MIRLGLRKAFGYTPMSRILLETTFLTCWKHGYKQNHLAKHFYSIRALIKRKQNKFFKGNFLSSVRSFSSEPEGEDDGKTKPPLLMDFEPAVRPEMFLTLKNWIMAKVIIQPYLDSEFALKEFTRGAKQALVLVSSYLAGGDFQSLQGLVAEEALSEIKKNYSRMNVKERQELSVKLTDILFSFPYQVGIIFDEETEKRFAEITVVYHCLNGFEELRSMDKKFTDHTKDEITICNYRFIREYTKDIQSDWTLNRIGHFKLCHLEN